MTTNLQCDTDSNLFCVTAAACSMLSVSSLKAPLAAPQLLSTQWVTALCSQNKTWHAVWARTSNLPGRVRLAVSHQNIHHLAECHFWLEHGQKTLFAIVQTVCDSREDMAPTQASGSYDRWQLASSVPLLQSVLLLKSAACLLTTQLRSKLQITDECVCMSVFSTTLALVLEMVPFSIFWYQANQPVFWV